MRILLRIQVYEGYLCGHTTSEGSSPVSWIVMGWKMKVFRHVKMFSKVRVETWIQSYTKVRVLRNYALYDEEGDAIALAAGEWVAVDGDKGTFLRITPGLLAAFDIREDKNNFPGYRFPDIRSVELPAAETRLVTPGLQMADYNGHIHNSEYLNLAAEICPQAVTADDVEIVYRTQILPGNTVLLERSELMRNDELYKIAIKSPDGHDLHALVTLGV